MLGGLPSASFLCVQIPTACGTLLKLASSQGSATRQFTSATPSSSSSYDYRSSDARIAEHGLETSSVVSKSAKVVQGHVAEAAPAKPQNRTIKTGMLASRAALWLCEAPQIGIL